MKRDKKVLIVVPDQNVENRRGGVHNFYKKIESKLESHHEYYLVNNDEFPTKNKIYTTYIHYVRIKRKLKAENFDCLLLNPSLKLNAILRDSLYILAAKRLKIETIVFWRGWNFDNIKYLKYPFRIITKSLLKAEKSIVLYSKISNSLRELGYKKEVHSLTTMVDDMVFDYQVKQEEKEMFNLVFLSRVEVYKGVHELLEAYQILKSRYPNMQLTIAGNGAKLENLKDKVKSSQIKDVTFSGYVVGEKKYELLSLGDLFVFPSYSEGMPNAVLEAMAIGLPVVTTRVGGLNDFFKDNEMGHFVEMKDAKDLADKIERLYLDTEKRKKISVENRKYASDHFKRSIVYNNLKEIINA